MAFPSLRAKLSLAAWLEAHTEFRLPTHSKSLSEALNSLEQEPLNGSSYLDQFCNLKRYFNRGVLALLFVFFVLGLMAVPPAFAIDQANQVNIFWLLIVLLGFHAINLIIWFLTMMATTSYTSDGKGIFLNSLIFMSKKVSKHSHIKTNMSDAFFHWQCHPATNKWLVSFLSHSAWGCYLLAGWLMTLLLLLTNQVNFVWETTLLSDQDFLALTKTLSVIPNGLGIAVPNELDVFASRIGITNQTADTRQHWASFLLASLMIYGVFPRLILVLFSLVMYQLKRTTQASNAHEKIIENRYQETERQNRTIVDHENVNKTGLNDGSEIDTSRQAPSPLLRLRHDAFQGDWALFEWSTTKPAFLHSIRSLITLNSREEQSQFLASAHSDSVYVLVNGKHSPDRGTRRFFSHAKMNYPRLCMVISQEKAPLFSDDWQRLAKETAVPIFAIQGEE